MSRDKLSDYFHFLVLQVRQKGSCKSKGFFVIFEVMVADYAKLMNFVNNPIYGNMYEAAVTKSVYHWMDNISADIDENYRFQVTYIFNNNALAIDAVINVQRYRNCKWQECGSYSASAPITIDQLICECEPESVEASDFPSQPIHYYVEGYYEPGYYV